MLSAGQPRGKPAVSSGSPHLLPELSAWEVRGAGGPPEGAGLLSLAEGRAVGFEEYVELKVLRSTQTPEKLPG